MDTVKDKKFLRFFKYDDEYISGSLFVVRSLLNLVLTVFLGLGIYMQSVNAYKRGKSLKHFPGYLWAIFGFFQFPLLIFLQNIYLFEGAEMIYNLPVWYLVLWSGKTIIEDELVSFNELNNLEGLFMLKNKVYSGNAYVVLKNFIYKNRVLEEYIFIKGKKILHKKKDKS